MSDKEKMLVEYLGDKPMKKDNVLNSGAIWNGKGDIQELPMSVGFQLTQKHPDIWCECTDETAVASPTNDKTSEIDVVINSLKEMDDPKEVRDYLKKNFELSFAGNPKVETMLKKAREHMSLLADNEAAASKREAEAESNENEPQVVNGIELTDKLQPLVALAQAGNFSTDPEEAVSQAIDMLGGTDSGFYDTQTGMPSLEAVQLLVGPEFATVERIDIAMANRSDNSES